MKLEINDAQRELLIELLGKYHAMEWMQGKDNSATEGLIKIVGDALKKEGKEHIFHRVFQEVHE